ncbi:hypothetical protein F3Y22_tig00110505pilonHSYRG00270 [Hibiscus syriacus]|uniref:Myb-like domain-containing protein n=1 Tax=Hibiscus syriacus TaxID=106335 RepID=A0A6A3ABH4_HIBSY|nr:trihelix transcription factor GT-2-like [Hibiscus syriacus]KAE8701820.1 hypothetical protein F3Y22_tig00110505pilonHSYRG00270 [Hibiscus syriacus]
MGDSSMVEGSAEAATVPGIHDGSEGEEDKGRVDEGDRSFGGNRWPRQETLALLKIRSDMHSVFRDSIPKGPLWEEVSRKLSELGYHRSAKKCKEKFENVYKYHKRTKYGRTSKAKTYRFFDQLEAFQNNNVHSLRSLLPLKPISVSTSNPTNVPRTNNVTVPIMKSAISSKAVPMHSMNPCLFNLSSNLFSTCNSSSTTSNDDSYGGSSGKKRKIWKEFFKRLTKEVIDKQEELQNKFLQTIDKYEQKRMAREEAWRIQEMAGINKEHEILVQERSKAAAKDAAVLAFLQNISGQQVPSTVQVQPQPRQENPPPEPPPPVKPMSVPFSLPPPPLQRPKPQPPPTEALNFDTGGNNNNNNVVPVSVSPNPSRWPKAEIEALIKLRTNLNIKYQNNGAKGPLWEEISSAMRNLGYNRSSKRCKEKWENINKYYKKVKENNNTRPEYSKTCPYFHQLDALYKEKLSKPDSTMVPLMVRPEQQWQQQQEVIRQASLMEEEADRENPDVVQDNEDDNGDTEDEYEGMISS